MARILWITNKYTDGIGPTEHFPEFLAQTSQELNRLGHDLYIAIFNPLFRKHYSSKNFFYFQGSKKSYPPDEIRKIENEYGFTFKQAFYPDIIQVSLAQNKQQIDLPESDFKNMDRLPGLFNFLLGVILKNRIDVVITDQAPGVAMDLSRAICLKHNKIFLRYNLCFLDRSIFCQQFEFGREKLIEAELDPNVSLANIKAFIRKVRRGKQSYFLAKSKTYSLFQLAVEKRLSIGQYLRHLKNLLKKPLLLFENEIAKRLIEKKFDPSVPYFFFGLHFPTESSVTLRALPYLNQLSLIESISRVLPYGYTLYVREHPHAREYFSPAYLARLNSLSGVKLISANIPVHLIIKNSRGIITYNSTTGVESLIFSKPVLAFAPNVYSGIHPAVDPMCTNLYEIGPRLVKLAKTKVNQKDTEQYLFKLFKMSSPLSTFGETFLSRQDAANKAKIFSKNLKKVVDKIMVEK